MEAFGAIMMVVALAWPIVGGAVTCFVGGLMCRHGLVSLLIDTLVGAAFGFAVTFAFLVWGSQLALPDQANLAVTLGLPIVGGLLGLWVKGKFSRG